MRRFLFLLFGGQVNDYITKAKILDELRSARAEWDALIAEIPQDRLLEPGATGEWSVRDVITHLTSFDRWFVNASEAQFRGEMPPTDGTEFMPWDERNAIHHQRTLHLSLDEVQQQSRDTFQRLLEVVEQHDEDFLTKPQQIPGIPQPIHVWEQLAGNHYDHYRLHAGWIREWLASH
jgi:hypothetical protein